jgi:hypothetical protein
MKKFNTPKYLINNQNQIKFTLNSDDYDQLIKQGFFKLKQNTQEFKTYKKNLRTKRQNFIQKIQDLGLPRNTLKKNNLFTAERVVDESYSKYSHRDLTKTKGKK